MRTFVAGLGIAVGMGFGGSGVAMAMPTVDLTSIEPGQYPVCFEEDCSDQPGQVGMWEDTDTGNWYLELGESVTYLVVDDTAR